MLYKIYDTERAGYWRVVMDLDHAKGVALADAIDSDGRFSFLFYRERADIDAFVIGVGLVAHSVPAVESNAAAKDALAGICRSVLGECV